MDEKPNIEKKKTSTTIKALVIIGAVILILVGLRFGLIGGLIGAFVAGVILKKTGTVSPNSAWVKETKGVTIAKYILLGLVLLGLIALAVGIFLNR